MGRPVRSARYDTIRGLLMLSVVFQHFLELFGNGGRLYCVNELFIMPAFVFLSGRMAKFRPGAMLRRVLLPYAAFQVLYWLFDRYALGNVWDLQLTTPYWLLWYLPSLFFWTLLLPALDADGPKRMAAVLLGLTALGLAAGFDESVGRYLSLSRTVAFLPFFAAGFYAGRLRLSMSVSARLLTLAGAACGAVLSVWLTWKLAVPREALYLASGYESSGAGPEIRLLIYLAGACWIFLIFRAVPDRSLPGLTALGRRTMPVYLCHGFIVRLAGKWGLFRFSWTENLCLALGLALAVCALLGRDWRGAKKRCAEGGAPFADGGGIAPYTL